MGPRFKFADSKSFRMYWAALYMFEYEKELSDIFQRDHRLSSYLSFAFQPNKVINLDQSTYYQPRLDKLNDYRFASEVSLGIKITQTLSFNTYFEWTFDSKPPPGVVQTTYFLSNGLKISFQPKEDK